MYIMVHIAVMDGLLMWTQNQFDFFHVVIIALNYFDGVGAINLPVNSHMPI